MLRKFLLVLSIVVGACSAWAGEAEPAAADPALEARLVEVTSLLRCLVCQNQTIADSHAELAIDLKNEVREMLRAGKSDQEIVDFMVARYGDFVLYKPRVRTTTLLLWFGPGVLMVLGLGALFFILRKRARRAAEPALTQQQREEVQSLLERADSGDAK